MLLLMIQKRKHITNCNLITLLTQKILKRIQNHKDEDEELSVNT